MNPARDVLGNVMPFTIRVIFVMEKRVKDKKVVQIRSKKEESTGKKLTVQQKSSIEMLEEILKSAKEGNVDNVFVVAIGEGDGEDLYLTSGYANLAHHLSLLGAIENNKIRFNESIEEFVHGEL